MASFCAVEFQMTVSEFRKRKKKIVVLGLGPPKTDVKEVSVQSCIDIKVMNKKRNLCSCKVESFAFFAAFVAVAFVVA